jgi:NAD(P)-dependent dehydrogenase (short-subunit alcohol dehydrogenase family)
MSTPESHSMPRVALVTGAGGAIGGASARKLHEDGFHLLAVDLSAERLATLEAELDNVTTMVLNVTDATAVASAVSAAAQIGGGHIEVLCTATGISDGGAALDEIEDQMWRDVLEANLYSAYLMCSRVLPYMIGSGGGTICNIASVAGLRGGRSGVAYTASKWAVVGLSQNIASHLGPEGIRSHAICPSRIEGVFTLGNVKSTARGIKNRSRDTARPAFGKPEDVAAVISFLASDAARHLNGLALPVDGGWLAF